MLSLKSLVFAIKDSVYAKDIKVVSKIFKQKKDYCCVYIVHKHYSIRMLDFIKHDSRKLLRFYYCILKDLAEIINVDPTVILGN